MVKSKETKRQIMTYKILFRKLEKGLSNTNLTTCP